MLPNALKESMAGAGVDDDDAAATRDSDRIKDTGGRDIAYDGVMSDSMHDADDGAVSTLADETALASEFPSDSNRNTRWDDDAVTTRADDAQGTSDAQKSKGGKLGIRIPLAASAVYLLGLGGAVGYLAFAVPAPAPAPPPDIAVTVALPENPAAVAAAVEPTPEPEPQVEPVTEPVIAAVEPEPVAQEPVAIDTPEPVNNSPATSPAPVGETVADPTVITPVDRPAGTPPDEPRIALQERSEFGPLPIVAADGQRPSVVYARRVVPLDVPRIALIMTDLGLDEAQTQVAIERLPADISLAFHPYAPDLNDKITAARLDGHESLLAIPMQPLDYPLDDPGPNPLMTEATPQENRIALYRSLGSAEGYVGLTNFMGSALLENRRVLTPIISEIANRGLLFIDDNTAINSISDEVATGFNMPYGRSSRLIDALPTAADIDEQLAGLEALAKLNGTAIGFAQPFPVTLQRLDEWIPLLRSRGIDLVPVSAIAKRALQAAPQTADGS